MGAGAENLVWAWQMGFVGSVFFGYAAVLLAATRKVGRRGDAGAAAALLAGVMCSGIGLVMVLVTAVAFAAWYAAFGHAATTQVYARPSLGGSLAFTWVGMTSAAEMGSGLRWLGAPLVVGVAGWLAWRLRRAPREHPVAVAGALGFIAMFALISTGRLQYGAESARQSRYIYVAVALLIPLTGVVLQRLMDHGRLGQAAAALLVGWAFLHGARVLVLSENQHRAVTANTRRLVLAAAAGLDQPGSTPDMGLRPDPVAAPTLNLARIAGFKRDGALPAG
ncbi:MAG TPA: hypothetical protein VIN56_06590 [Candidatus Dormibacteraeota bacterium]|jgi:hypothetical protein